MSDITERVIEPWVRIILTNKDVINKKQPMLSDCSDENLISDLGIKANHAFFLSDVCIDNQIVYQNRLTKTLIKDHITFIQKEQENEKLK